ncbi:MAG: iron-containing alcohol dehydrogenase [Lachnospiraceae bacterium]|nr:iron-containing alcohol dehydrogenase [Lachnospiraceae bacterium]
MAAYSFSVPQEIVFGRGTLDKLPEYVKKLDCKKAFIISGPHLKKIGLVDKCRDALKAAGIKSGIFTETEGNPGTDTVDKAAELFLDSGSDLIIAFGGGSPIDVAKAVAILGTYGGAITDYEGVGKVPGSVIPIIAIPTTAGTGSEVTAFSVITDHSRNYKLTVGSNYLLPKCAILDPELIMSVPVKTASACGVDALVHAIESYISLKASPFSDMMALKALELIGKNLRAYVANRQNKIAADAMLQGSLYAGIAFSHARLGNVHAMSHPVSAYFDVPHGLANAILLPFVTEFNELSDKGKYYDIYRCISLSPVTKKDFVPHMLTQEIRVLNLSLDIPGTLVEVGVKEELFELMTDDAMKSGNIAVNPRQTTRQDILDLYNKAFR